MGAILKEWRPKIVPLKPEDKHLDSDYQPGPSGRELPAEYEAKLEIEKLKKESLESNNPSPSNPPK
jgi:hypothetical protein